MDYNFNEPIPRQGTQCVKWDLRKAIFGNDEVLPMWVADMDIKTPHFVIDAIKERTQHEILGYSIRPNEYYQALMQWIKSRHQWDIKKNWVLFSPGIVPAVNLSVLAFTQPGDEIIVQPPVYFPFFQAIKDNGRQLVYNPLKRQGNRYMMNMDDLEQKTNSRTRMIIISNPHNPGGMVWQPKELKALLEHCKKHHLLLISDEIHSDLVLPQHKHTVAATVTDYAPDITITMMAPSKTFNMAGLASSSVIISNPQLRDKYNALNETLHLYMGNVFGNVASQAAYLHGAPWLQALLDHIQGNIEYVKEFLARELPNIGMIEPEATYMVWLDFSKTGLRGKALNNHLINKALLGLNPGTQFGPGGEAFMRMNLACPLATVQEAMKRLKASF